MYLYIDKDKTVVLKDVLAILQSNSRKDAKTVIIDRNGRRIFTKRTQRLIAERIDGKKG